MKTEQTIKQNEGQKLFKTLLEKSTSSWESSDIAFMEGLFECEELGYEYAIFAQLKIILRLGGGFVTCGEEIAYFHKHYPTILKKAAQKDLLLTAIIYSHDFQHLELLTLPFTLIKDAPEKDRIALAKKLEKSIEQKDPFIEYLTNNCHMSFSKDGDTGWIAYLRDPSLLSQLEIPYITDTLAFVQTSFKELVSASRKIPKKIKCPDQNKDKLKDWNLLPIDTKTNVLEFLSTEEVLNLGKVNKENKSFVALTLNHHPAFTKPLLLAQQRLEKDISLTHFDVLCPTGKQSTLYELYRFRYLLDLHISSTTNTHEKRTILAAAILRLLSIMLNLKEACSIDYFQNRISRIMIDNIYKNFQTSLKKELEKPEDASAPFKAQIDCIQSGFYPSKMICSIENTMEAQKERNACVNSCYQSLIQHRDAILRLEKEEKLEKSQAKNGCIIS